MVISRNLKFWGGGTDKYLGALNMRECKFILENNLKQKKYTEIRGWGVISQVGGLYPLGGCKNITAHCPPLPPILSTINESMC